ncbi:MAG: OprD family outer membrane porin [Sulfurospirillum sp.]
MKLAKLSLAAIVVAGLASSSFAADTLADAFKNGKVTGELKAYYFANENRAGDRDSIFNTGIMLNYKTDTLYGFAANFTAQGNAAPFADKGAKADYIGSEYGSGAVLSEAYLSYTLGKTTAMVGRMFLDTPLVSGSGSRITKEAFEGAAIINTDLPNTTLIAGYVQKFQSRTNGNGDVGKFTKTFATGSSVGVGIDNGAYTLAAINKSVAGLTLTGAYAYADVFLSPTVLDGGLNIGYVEALYEGKAGSVGYVLGVQDYYNKFQDSKTADDTINAFAVKAGLSFKGLNATVAYSQTSDDAVAGGAIVSGLGNGADLLYTDAVINSPGYTRDTKAYMADLNYDVTSALNLGARYVEAKDDFNNAKGSFTSVYGYYKCDVLKGLKLGLEYENQGKDLDAQDLWVKANYKF